MSDSGNFGKTNAMPVTRELREEKIAADLVVAGGGLSGVCCAITAARAGLKVTLVQDRPVLGGNASSEVRLWILGATSHMGNNNRWAREGGVIDEILIENLWRNPEGNPLIFDTILLEKISLEPGIRLLLHLVAGNLLAARGLHREALREFETAGQVQASMAGEHALSTRVTGRTIATQARLGTPGRARATLATLDGRRLSSGEIRNAVAVVCLAEHDPAAARRALRAVLRAAAPDTPYLLVEAHVLDALACRDLGDQRAASEAVGQALNLAEPDRLVLPFAMTGGWELLAALPQGTSHAALVAGVLDAVRGGAPAGPRQPAMAPAEELSPSELRVLRYLPTNLTRPEIAAELSVSLNTVNTHVRRIYAKLGATDRSSAVQRGRELRLLAAGHLSAPRSPDSGDASSPDGS